MNGDSTEGRVELLKAAVAMYNDFRTILVGLSFAVVLAVAAVGIGGEAGQAVAVVAAVVGVAVVLGAVISPLKVTRGKAPKGQ